MAVFINTPFSFGCGDACLISLGTRVGAGMCGSSDRCPVPAASLVLFCTLSATAPCTMQSSASSPAPWLSPEFNLPALLARSKAVHPPRADLTGRALTYWYLRWIVEDHDGQGQKKRAVDAGATLKQHNGNANATKEWKRRWHPSMFSCHTQHDAGGPRPPGCGCVIWCRHVPNMLHPCATDCRHPGRQKQRRVVSFFLRLRL